MLVDGKQMRPIWLDDSKQVVKIIDQRRLPHDFVIVDLITVDDAIEAIRDMYVRGAPLIGVTAAYAVYLATVSAPQDTADNDAYLERECKRIKAARPTAVNLAWAVDRMHTVLLGVGETRDRITAACKEAADIAEEEVENCRRIGENGLALIAEIGSRKYGGTVNVLTHCNAGWLACVEYGTATAPVYAAFDSGVAVHVWVDETRPLNQGARLTAWELGKHGVPHTVIADNTGGHLMQHGMVDIVIVGTDRTTCTGDVANKIGTYLKALAAKDNDIPFYVALPSSTFDWELRNGVAEIPIEERNADEVRFILGLDGKTSRSVLVPPQESPAANFAFDVTPARLVTEFITERGVCRADEEDIRRLFPGKGTDA
jgi:methylthioribose-1-phosphate isomerase